MLEDKPKGLPPDVGEKPLGQTGDLAPLEHNAAGRGSGHASQEAQQGSFPRAAGAFQHRYLVRGDGEAQVVQGDIFIGPPLIENLSDVLKFDHQSLNIS